MWFNPDPENGPSLVEGYRPGLLAEIVALHMAYYGPSWNFGAAFECKVAGELAHFLADMRPERDAIYTARDQDGALVGAIAVQGPTVSMDIAHLRWFIVAEPARGHGLGRALMRRALSFCDALECEASYLTTFAGLDAARRLYDHAGFKLVATSDRDQWNGGVREQRFERARGAGTL